MENDWSEQVERRIVALETRNAVDEVHRINISNRLGAIEDVLTWLVRLIIGGLLIAAVTFTVQGGFIR